MTNPAPLGGDERPPPAPIADPLAVDEVPPPAVPAAPAYESAEPLDPTPAYDSLAAESATQPLSTPSEPLVETVYDSAADVSSPAGPLEQVKAFAADKPAVFLGAALAAGWLVGKLLPSSSDDDDDD
jgi:hypothetical protein